ncbi:MAG: Flp pilus assembly complex ATPase component TadA, partial [Chloroflexi bacterium]|nr:Flp pilus assembly complex ATPase component TadA [Chloroflexota bacterium]MCI0841816.1 Flp pilus assembly complex ATPase component TadA [Chloroflexota bacterium]
MTDETLQATAEPELTAEQDNLDGLRLTPDAGEGDGAATQRPISETDLGIGETMVELGLITHEDLQQAQKTQRSVSAPLSKVLVEQELATHEELAMALSIYLNVPLIDLKRHHVNPEALKLIPEPTAKKYNLIPIDIVANSLLVVMEDPGNILAIEDLGVQSNKGIQPAAGIPSEIADAIDLNYKASAEIEAHIHEFSPSSEGSADIIDFDASEAVAQAAIVRALDLIITQAVRDRASDIHVEPQAAGVRIRYRIDGILHDIMNLPSSAINPLISRIKILAGMDITERRRPQDGQFSVRVGNRDVDVRAATIDTSYGETAVLRLLDRSATLFDLIDLGFQPNVYSRYREMLRSSFGMMLVSGPTGAGKTTTLYASINQLDAQEHNIMTIEDPIEYRFDGIKQIQVNERAGLTFSGALRAMMRLDPDIILVGEIRDNETALTAVQAALTGHLVMTSIHANDAASVPFRLVNLGVEPYLISTVVVGVVAQRMVRNTCPHCAERYQPAPEEMAAYRSEMGDDDVVMYKGVGCNFCSNTGFLNRSGVFELLHFNEAIRDLLQAGGGVSDIRRQAMKDGMITMRHNGMEKVKEGKTTPAEVMRQIIATE